MLTRTDPGTAPGMGAEDRAGVSARSMAVGLAVGVPVSLVLLYVATRGVAWEEVRSALRGARPGPLAAAVLALAGVYVVQGARWRWIARRQARASTAAFVGLVVAGVGVNNVLPGRVGDLLRAHWLSRRTGTPRSRTLATVVVDRACDVFVLLAFLIATFSFTPRRTWIDRVYVASLVVTAVLAAGLVATRLYVAHRERDGRTLPLSIRLSWPGRQLSGLIRGTAAVVGPGDLAVAIALSVAAWVLWAAGLWLVADALGIDLALWQAAFMTGLVNLGTAVPSSPGFVGTYQWLCVSGLGLFDVGASQAFAFSLVLQAAWFVPTTAVGVPLAVRLSMERRRA
ncbi:MAG TPA: lysylphosphatidylglycerol synthase transmembrane domain-containing protein [Gaiellales bacterium]|nr:lysylphosphatidylglycerol synthase transmembrane domain-containing protein [Gaiellales bacterium]